MEEIIKIVEKDDERIWREECSGRCAVMHLEKCPEYDDGKCSFPETEKAKEIVDSYRKRK